jgi:hypothetical protein
MSYDESASADQKKEFDFGALALAEDLKATIESRINYCDIDLENHSRKALDRITRNRQTLFCLE